MTDIKVETVIRLLWLFIFREIRLGVINTFYILLISLTRTLYLRSVLFVISSLSVAYFLLLNSGLITLSSTYPHTSWKLHRQGFFIRACWDGGLWIVNTVEEGWRGGDWGAQKGVSDPSAWAPRAQRDQCVRSRASSAHNEGKWEFNTNFLTKSLTPPASVAGLTSRHPQLHHHNQHCNQTKHECAAAKCLGTN